MKTKAEIQELIRNNLPIVFGKTESVESDAFRKKYEAMIDYATAVSGPFLGTETIRYQSMLLYVSLLFLSVSLFRIANIKIGESAIAVDRKLLVIYAIFIGVVALVFLTKAHMDYRRASFVREKGQAYTELRELMVIGLLRSRIQECFWLETFDTIGRSYKRYDDAVGATLHKHPDFKHISIQVINLDRTELNKNADTKAEITKQDASLAVLAAELADDEKRFQEEADTALSIARAQPADPFNGSWEEASEKIHAAYAEHLRKWLGARNELVSEHLDLALEGMKKNLELNRLEAMRAILKRVWTIRRIYAALEIFAPVAFAIFAILYVYVA